MPAQTRLMDSPYYSVNPSGRVPYLVRGGGVGMEESMVISRYLELASLPFQVSRRQIE